MDDPTKREQPEQDLRRIDGDTPEAGKGHCKLPMSKSAISAWAADMRHQQEHTNTPPTEAVNHTHDTIGRKHTHTTEADNVLHNWQQNDKQHYTLTLGTGQARVWRLPSGEWSALISQEHTAVEDASFSHMRDAFSWAEIHLSEIQAKL